MLMGEYGCNIDAKGRFNFPSKLKDTLGDSFVIAKGFNEKCLYVYSLSEWEALSQKIKEMPISKTRAMRRRIFPSANIVSPDKQGRIVLSQVLKEYAEIEKEMVVVGISDKCEIWSKTNWDITIEAIDNDEMAQTMEELGI